MLSQAADRLIRRLEREWRILEPERQMVALPATEAPEAEPGSIPQKRLKVGRVD